MIYLFDTTAFSALMQRDDHLRIQMERLSPDDRLAICTITRGEVQYGLERLDEGKRRRDLQSEASKLFEHLICLPITEAIADRYAKIKRETERKGMSLDENDLWIAATVFNTGGILVTQDSDFKRVTGLQVQDWTQQPSF